MLSRKESFTFSFMICLSGVVIYDLLKRRILFDKSLVTESLLLIAKEVLLLLLFKLRLYNVFKYF